MVSGIVVQDHHIAVYNLKTNGYITEHICTTLEEAFNLLYKVAQDDFKQI